jgi:hypothetical protein
MYGQGLGDCFLLTLPRTAATPAAPTPDIGRPVFVLIDCGVIMGTPGGGDRMRRVVEDIRQTTLDHGIVDAAGAAKGHLDLLVITHRHWDHLSGFVYAADAWRGIQIDALWTSWAEDPAPGGLAEILGRLATTQRQALVAAADRATRLGLADHLETTFGLLSFLSEEPGPQGFAAARSVEDAFDLARTLAGGTPTLCEPGDVRRLPGTAADAYVLGPPKDLQRLRQMDPSAREQETFGHAGDRGGEAFGRDPIVSLRRMLDEPSAFNALAMPLLGAAPAAGTDEDDAAALRQRDLFERSFPFEAAVRVPLATAEAAALNESAEYPALASYYDEVNHWRRIDGDWLAATEAFALAVDNLINNTSLVLAIELPPARPGAERKVLLFVADAQVGNWLSWDEIPRWRPREGAQPSQRAPDLDDLLGRAVFYKVGHHGSHNATLKAKGVERMRERGTRVAFVPVSPGVADKIKGWSEMPLEPLLEALHERGYGVVLPGAAPWRAQEGTETERARDRLGLTLSDERLPAMVKRPDRDDGDGDGNGEQIEDDLPLWVQVTIGY